MSRLGWRAAAKRGLPAADRWAQAVRDGQVRLDGFTQAELDCVTLDPEFLPADARSPALQAVGPLLPVLAAQRAGREPLPMVPAMAAFSHAAAGLERHGYLRPGWPAKSDTPVQFELAGWSADPAGSKELRPVTILGDLGIVTRARAQPSFVVEVAQPYDNARPDPGTDSWRLVARMYATQQPSAGVVEFPPEPDGSLSPCSLLWQERAVWALWAWSGIDLDEMRYESNPAFVEPVPDVPTAEAAREFASVRRLRVAQPDGQEVSIRTLVTAAADRTHWILDGDHAECAVRVAVNQIGERIQSLIQPVGGTGGD
jgi:hypothetical protein